MTEKSDSTKHYRTYEEEMIAKEKEAAAQAAANERTKQYTEGTAKRLEVYEQVKSRPKIRLLLAVAGGMAFGMVIGAKMCSKPKLTPGQIETICGLPEPCPEPKVVESAPPKPSGPPPAKDLESGKKQLPEVVWYRKALKRGRYYSAFERLFKLLESSPGAISVREEIDLFVSEGNLEALKLLRKKLKILSGSNAEYEELRAYASTHIRKMKESQ